MKPVLTAALIYSLTLAPSYAESSLWRDSSGNPVLDTESMKSKNDFAGALVATTDEDWQEKWNTAPETKPRFTKAGTVPYGKKVFVLIFFANAKLDQSGNANVRCDLRMVAPTGKVSVEQKDLTCFAGPLQGSQYNLRLSGPAVAFSGDPGDPPGIWSAEVVLRDAIRDVELPLRTTFTLK